MEGISVFLCVLEYLLSLFDSTNFRSYKRIKGNIYAVPITESSFSQDTTFKHKMSDKHIKL